MSGAEILGFSSLQLLPEPAQLPNSYHIPLLSQLYLRFFGCFSALPDPLLAERHNELKVQYLRFAGPSGIFNHSQDLPTDHNMYCRGAPTRLRRVRPRC